MYLKELEIFGFKSFPEKTILKFEPGITVIVGPNGCGKSNILDAIKWALGEQSPKSLRGSKMEDVIFNGTENYPPLNYAEVNLNFFNEDRYLPIDYKEVSISRKLYRSGESEYFINKNPVRLKDIEDLFMGTGIGEATYSFIEQGKIELFLSYKPEEKRLIFDEASGIVKYKESKKDALKKLEETEENILRLNDIISEVKRQIKYLEKQVEKTKKYKELQAELQEIEIKIAALQFQELEKKINILLDEFNRLKEGETSKMKELNEIKNRVENLSYELEKLRKENQDVNNQILYSNSKIENLNQQIDFNKKRIEEIKSRNKNLEEAEKNIQERIGLHSKRIEEENSKLTNIEKEILDIQEKIKGLEKEKLDLSKENTKNLEEIEKEKLKILELEAEDVNSRNQLVELQVNLSNLSNRNRRLLLDKAKVEEFLKESSNKDKNLQEKIANFEESLNSLKEKKKNLLLKEEEQVFLKESLYKNLIEKEKELVELNSYYEFLKDLRIKYESFSSQKRVVLLFKDEPKNVNKMIVSLKGVIFSKEGDFYRGEVEAKVIYLEEAQLEEKINLNKSEIEKIKIKINEIEVLKESLLKEIENLNSQIQEEEKRFQEFIQEKDNLKRDFLRLKEELELLDKELLVNSKELEELENKKKELENKIDLCQKNLELSKINLKNFQDRTSKNSERINEIELDLGKILTQKEFLLKEKEATVSNLSIFKEERNSLFKNFEETKKEREINSIETKDLEKDIEKFISLISEFKEKIKTFSIQKEELEKKEKSIQESYEQERQKTEVLNRELEELRQSLYNKKLEIQGLDHEKEKIRDYLKQVYHFQIDPKEFVNKAKEIQENIEVLLGLKENIKKKLENLGEVNIVAIEEFEELKKREDFLEKQKTDLVTSKENLKKAIQKINRTSKELFLETFNKIEEEFKKNFRFLFGGGKTNLILLDPENVLESGIEIEVQPPGKKLQNVTLLSGGEKALTTIALIFAIFKVRPSPICVLDEIDAPLDEANIDRFNQLLKDFSNNSQFILITHNKKTMSKANVLYGVTMQEKGVSKLVSVKFASEEPIPTS